MQTVGMFAAHSRTEGPARTVGLGLAYFANHQTRLAWPSDQKLMSFARLGKSRLHQMLRQLERSGEIRRVRREEVRCIFEELDQPVPRRIYLIDPQGAGQLSLINDEGHPVCTFEPVEESALSGGEGALHAGAGSNHLNQQHNTPPAPQGGSAHTPDLSSPPVSSGQTPRVTMRVERSAAARRRRRRRAGQAQPAAPSGSCPLHPVADSAASGQAELEEQWKPIAHRLRERVGETQFEIWLAGAHLHALAPAVQLALAPGVVAWVADRYGRLLAEAAGVDVELVACHAPLGALP